MEELKQRESSLKILNTSTLTGLIGDNDPAMIRKFQIDFLKQAKQSMAKIVNLYKSNELPEIMEEAHFLKTSAKAIGAEQVSVLLEAMEDIALSSDNEKCRNQIKHINNAVKQVYEAILNEK